MLLTSLRFTNLLCCAFARVNNPNRFRTAFVPPPSTRVFFSSSSSSIPINTRGRRVPLSSRIMSSASDPNNYQGAAAPGVTIVTQNDSATTMRNLVSSLAQLSSTTEMSSYGQEQWEFLLKAGDVSAVVVSASDDDDGGSNKQQQKKLLGSVLRIVYGGFHTAYGMMLVSPKARGRGLARRLLEAAMDIPLEDISNASGGETDSMKILGTCTEMGRPFYEKVGYRRVSTVTKMTVALDQLLDMHVEDTPSSHDVDVRIDDGDESNRLMKDMLALDRQATGLDRSKTLTAIQSYPYVSTVTITTRANNEDGDYEDKLVMAALITRHTNSTTAMVGPILGEESYVPILLQSVRDHYSNPNSRNQDDDNTTNELALIVSDHSSLVQRLSKAGFQTGFEFGAMTMDGAPMPGDRSLYLGIIHPTLG